MKKLTRWLKSFLTPCKVAACVAIAFYIAAVLAFAKGVSLLREPAPLPVAAPAPVHTLDAPDLEALVRVALPPPPEKPAAVVKKKAAKPEKARRAKPRAKPVTLLNSGARNAPAWSLR